MRHLTAAQIAEWTAGERSPEAVLHVAECDECRTQVSEFKDVLAQFRESAQWVPVPAPEVRSRRPVLWPRLVAVAATVLLLLAIPVIRQREAQRRALVEQQDALLLQQVDAEIAQPVPDAMDPLVKLVTWNSNEAQSQ